MHAHSTKLGWLATCALVLPATAQTQPGGGNAGWVPQAADGGAWVTQADDQGHVARAFADAPGRSGADTQELVGPALWSALGPFGGDVDDVASSPTSPNVVLAGLAPTSGSGTLFRSTDAGATWTEVVALSGNLVHDIEFDAAGNAYIGTLNSVWKSTDDGASWAQLGLGIGLNDQVFEVTIDPNDATRIWAGVADALGGQTVNVMLSTNSGVTWVNRTPPLAAAMSCRGIALNPGNSNEVWTCFGGGFGGGAVWMSSNGGTSWTNRSAGLPGNPMTDVVHEGGRVLVCGGQLFGSQFVGLYGTTNGGVSWTPLHDGTWPLLVIRDIEIDQATPSRIFVASDGQGVYRSDNGGTSWSFGAGGTGNLAVREIHVDATSSSVIFTGSSSNAVWKSANSGTSFSASSTGIGALNVVSVAADPNDAERLAISFEGLNDGGVMTSDDGGANWTLENLPATRWSRVRFAPDGTPYAISDGPTTIAPEGVYRRIAGTWNGIGPDQGPLFESELVAMRFSVNDPNLILASGSDFGVAGSEPTIWRSANSGGTWTKVHEGVNLGEDVQDLEIVEDGTDTVMVACYTDFNTAQTGGALRSVNGGLSWVDASTGLAPGTQGNSLCPSPADANTFFLADNDFGAGGVFVTTDAGLTWTNTGYTQRANRIECDSGPAGLLYVSQTTSPWVLVSDDGGATFSPFDTGLTAIGFARDLFFAPGDADKLLLATSTGTYGTPRCGDVATYCTGKTNSLGCVPFITWTGVPSASSTTPFSIAVNDHLPSEAGFLVYGFKKSNLNFHGGKLCVKAPLTRWLPAKSANNTGVPPCTGVIKRNFNNRIQSGADPALTAGTAVRAQWFMRDPLDPAGFAESLSDGLQFSICP